jgi:hypothetical protein
MAAGSMDVVVKFIGDASSIQSRPRRSSTGGKLKSWAKGVAAAFGTAFVIDQLKGDERCAELADQVGARASSSAKAPTTWPGSRRPPPSPRHRGVRTRSPAASTFGTFGKSAGLAGDDLAGFSTDMVGLAGDLVVQGRQTRGCVTAIGAALRGESEPIRKYGVLLDGATLKARA